MSWAQYWAAGPAQEANTLVRKEATYALGKKFDVPPCTFAMPHKAARSTLVRCTRLCKFGHGPKSPRHTPGSFAPNARASLGPREGARKRTRLVPLSQDQRKLRNLIPLALGFPMQGEPCEQQHPTTSRNLHYRRSGLTRSYDLAKATLHHS
eukprot:9488382-Pyramimonas_sp.AAC.4